jgi:hypothetical protein
MGSISFDVKGLPMLQAVKAPVVDSTPRTADADASAPTASDTSPAGTSITLQQDRLVGRFEYNDDLHLVIITLHRADTGEVIQQLPPEQIVSMLQGIMEQLGQTVDRRG